MLSHGWPVLVLAMVTGVLASARLTRLAVQDDYPPVVWARARWRHLTHDGGWAELVDCIYCAAPWVTLPVLLAGWLSDLGPAWWLVCGWLAASYLASIVVAYDGG